MKIDFNHKYFNKPFSYLVCEDFLSTNDQNQIINEISDLDVSFEVKKVMGGRYQYNTDYLKKNSLSDKLYNFFNSIETFETIKNKLFLNEKSLSKFYTKQNFDKIVKNNQVKSKIRKLFPFFFKNNFFLHMDFSVAKKDYFREPHHDKNTRIINFLLYLNTLENSGGALEIYKYKKNTNNFSQFPKPDDVELDNKIDPKGGKLIVFLSTPDSVHGVEKFNPKKDEKRFFIYGSYTSYSKVEWVKNNTV